LLWLKRASRSIPQLLNPGAIDHAHYPVTCPNRTQSGQVVKIKPPYQLLLIRAWGGAEHNPNKTRRETKHGSETDAAGRLYYNPTRLLAPSCEMLINSNRAGRSLRPVHHQPSAGRLVVGCPIMLPS
jgi:hypothetical protein